MHQGFDGYIQKQNSANFLNAFGNSNAFLHDHTIGHGVCYETVYPSGFQALKYTIYNLLSDPAVLSLAV